MKTQQSDFEQHGVVARDMVRVVSALAGIFEKLTEEERIAFATLHLCTKIDHEIIRYDEDLCAICVGPIVLDHFMENDQCAKFFMYLIQDKSDQTCAFREMVLNQLNMKDSVKAIRERMLSTAKDILESNCVEGFC